MSVVSHPLFWTRVAGLSGATAVTLGAYGAHAMLHKTDNMKETWRVASNYHFIHTLALYVSATQLAGRKRNVVCGLFTVGMLLFSGACYTIVLVDQKKPFNYFAPFGGIAMILAWTAIAVM